MEQERRIEMRCSKKRTGIVLTIFVFTFFAFGCRHNDEPVPEENTTSAERITQGEQWLSGGHMQEYGDLLCEYGRTIYPQMNIHEQAVSGVYGVNEGLLCDLDGDGISPELLYLLPQPAGYTIEIYYLDNDGNLSIRKSGYASADKVIPKELICNYCASQNVWDMIVVEAEEQEETGRFYRYEEERCVSYGIMPGIPERQNITSDGEIHYDHYGFYTLKREDEEEGCIKIQYYQISEEEKTLKQKIPDFVETLPGVEEYWELAEESRRYQTRYGVWQIDFSCTLELQGTYMYPVAELHTADGKYLLIESDVGELGWLEKED